MTSEALVIIACSEPDPRIDPSHFFNLSTSSNTRVLRTAGGRTETIINQIHAIDQASGIGMIVVIQHHGCTWSPGDVEANIRFDILALKSSPLVRNGIPVVGYALDASTGQLKEVTLQRSTQDEAARQQVLEDFHDFAPFWG